MIMSGDRKGMVSMIIKKMGPVEGPEAAEEKEKVDGAEQDYEIGENAAVDEIFEAIESKDKTKFREALKSFIELCFDKLEQEPHEEFEEEESEDEE